MVTVTATIDQGHAATQLRKRTARQLEKRGHMMGVQAVKETQKLIENGLSNHDTGRGLTSMSDMPFRYTVDSGGDFPIVVSLHNDVGGASLVKFKSLEFGARGGLYVTETHFRFIGLRDGKKIVTKITKREAYAGNRFMKRGLGIASAGVYAGFQFTRGSPASTGFGAPRRRRAAAARAARR
jgi:hypothetical protein